MRPDLIFVRGGLPDGSGGSGFARSGAKTWRRGANELDPDFINRVTEEAEQLGLRHIVIGGLPGGETIDAAA
jgi:hypothetical protein